MAIKAIQAKVIIDSREKLEYLWLTHRLFNRTLPFVIGHVFKMKRGELGDDYKIIYDAITGNQNSFAKLEPLTQTKPPSKLGSGKNAGEWAEKASKINRSGNILFDRYDVLFANSEFWRKLFEMTIQLIHGSEELRKRWKQEHEDWLQEKEDWIKDNIDFMEVLPLFETFEAEIKGKITKRRGRWHLYMDFFRKHPELAAWQDGKSTLKDLTEAENKALLEKHFKKPGKILEQFFDNNPGLKALDRKYSEYLKYTRPWAKRKYKDGFKHPPTFTMPSPVKHPAWYSFKKGTTYKDLDISGGTVKLKVLTSATGKGLKGVDLDFAFSPDARLKRFKPITKIGKGKKAFSYTYEDPVLGDVRNAEIRGIKLIFKGSKGEDKPGKPYLIFTCDIEDVKSRLSLKQKSFDKYSAEWIRKKVFSEIPPAELTTCAVDLGIRHLAAATIRTGDNLIRTNFLKLAGPTLGHISLHKKQLRRGRRKRGKPIKGEESFIGLQSHVTNMGEDRFKKGAHAIVSFAYKNATDVIVLENLKGFIASATYEKGINKAFAAWNRGNLVKWIKQTADYYGIRVVEVDAFYSSRVCSKCGAPGARYGIKDGVPVFEWVGKLFACYKCGYRANADFNASVNLHRIFHGGFKRDGLTYKGKEAVFNGKKYVHEKEFADLTKGWNKGTPPEMRTEEVQF